MSGKISGYSNTATTFPDGSFWDFSKFVSPGTWQSQKVPQIIMAQLMLDSNVQQILQADLVTLAGASGLTVNKTYLVDGAVSGDRLLRVIAATASSLYQGAFDVTTGETGVYILSTDKFYPLITTFKIVATSAQILAGVDLPIVQCPQPPAGYAWEVITASARLVGATTPYDGSPDINIKANGASRQQFYDGQAVLAAGADTFLKLSDRSVVVAAATNDTIIPWDGVPSSDIGALLLSFAGTTSTAGDGTLTVYGTARLITL